MEYALRVAFFLFAPFVIVIAALLVPMGGAFVNIAVLLFVFLADEALRERARTRPWLARVLRRHLAFEEFYRTNPPKHFLYYMFYPLMLPYALVNRDARRELMLFKGYGLVGLLVILIGGVVRFFMSYPPELGLKQFVGPFAAMLVLETIVTLGLLLPICMTVVALHQQGHTKRLVGLLFIGLLSAGVAIGSFHHRRRAFPSIETRQRVALRTAAAKAPAKDAMRAALKAAWDARVKHNWERDNDGTVFGQPLDAAHAALQAFYRVDEAASFELWTTARATKPRLMILFAEGPRKGRPVFLAMRSDGTLVENPKDIPKEARKAMRSAGDLDLGL